MQLDVLLAVQDQRDVDAESGDPGDRTDERERRHHREARQHLEVLLVGVLELARRRGIRAGADAEVVEDHAVGVPGVGDFGEGGGEGLFDVDGHGGSPIGGVAGMGAS